MGIQVEQFKWKNNKAEGWLEEEDQESKFGALSEKHVSGVNS